MTGFRIRMPALVLASSLIVGVVPVVRAESPSVDVQRVNRQLGVMKEIVRATLETARDDAGQPLMTTSRTMPIEAYYLHGQGAVLIVSVPMSGTRGLFPEGRPWAHGSPSVAERAVARYELFAREMAESRYVAARMAQVEAAAALAAENVSADETAAAAASAKALEEMAQHLARQKKDAAAVQRELEQRMFVEKERAEEKREVERVSAEEARVRVEAERRASEVRLEALAAEVVEMLAGHGDSISVVQPDETVTVILRSGTVRSSLGASWWPAGSPARQGGARVVSIEKSSVTDLKSGKISRDDFDARVKVYAN